MAAQTVAELTIDEFRALIRETVTEVLAELLNDPDQGLELSDWAVARLEKAQREAATGQRSTKPLSEAARIQSLSA